MNNKITIYDLAKELNTTASTVSRAFINHPRISMKMKERVWALAKEKDFYPDSVASQLRTGKGSVIGVIVPRISRQFFSSVIESIENVANKAGYSILVAQSHEKWQTEKSIVRTMLAKKVDGFAISLAADTVDYKHLHSIINKGVPVVFFDRVPLVWQVNNVRLDDYQGAYDAVKHLIEQGCHRIAHLAGPQGISVYQQRQAGYLQALREADLPCPDELIFPNTITMKAGIEATKKIIAMSDRPDAIFSAGDYSAMGAIKVLKNNNIRIPDEIAVMGFANEPFDEFVDPPLSSVDQRDTEMGQQVAEMLLKEMGTIVTERQPHEIILEPHLIIRKSSLKK